MSLKRSNVHVLGDVFQGSCRACSSEHERLLVCVCVCMCVCECVCVCVCVDSPTLRVGKRWAVSISGACYTCVLRRVCARCVVGKL